MKHKELLENLHSREKELIKELQAIRTLTDIYAVIDETNEIIDEISDSIIAPKGTMKWENYALYVLRKLGGKAKAAKVVDAAIKANPDIDKKTIKSAIIAKLSIKYRAKVIDAIKGDNKKDGYIYVLEDTTMIRTK